MLVTSAHADGYYVIGKAQYGYFTAWNYNQTDREGTQAALLNQCYAQAVNCQVIAHIVEGCFAFATNGFGGYGYAGGESQQAANRNALRACRNHGNRGCRVENGFCETLAQQLWAQYNADWKDCFSGDLAACSRALGYYGMNEADRGRVLAQIAEIDRRNEQARLEETRRQEEERQRALIAAEQQERERARTTDATMPSDAEQREQIAYYERVLKEPSLVKPPTPVARTNPAPQVQKLLADGQLRGAWDALSRENQIGLLLGSILAFLMGAAFISVFRQGNQAGAAQQPAPAVPAVPARLEPPPPPFPAGTPAQASTPEQAQAALRALRLAHSLIFEKERPYEALTDPLAAKGLLQNATLAAKQIAIAENNDPSVQMEDTTPAGPMQFGVSELKAAALHIEGIARFADAPKKALAILEQAIAIKPEVPHYHYAYGLLAIDTNYAKALQALERAVALDPDDIEQQKTLLRAQNISKGERLIAGTVKAARTTYNVLWWTQVLVRIGLLAGLVISLLTRQWIPAVGFFVLIMIAGAILTAKDKINEKLGR